MATHPARLIRYRLVSQVGTLLALVLIPLSGLFRIDVADGAFVVLSRQIGFDDFMIVTGTWLALSTSLVLTYSAFGNAFCGWSCPQNSVSEWINRLQKRLLGKHAEANIDGSQLHVSQGKNHLSNWLVLGSAISFFSALAALIPLLYFYTPAAIWSFITLRQDAELAPHIHWIYLVFFTLFVLDFGFIRHFFCRYMCIYGVWQHSFKTRQTLRIVHEDSAPNECEHCSFCVTRCVADIDPRDTSTYDSCINCGVCIAACDDIRHKRGTGSSLLRFAIGGADKSAALLHSLANLKGRISVVIPMLLLGLSMASYGLIHYQPYKMVIDRAQGERMSPTAPSFTVFLAHKRYQPGQLTLSIEGLDAKNYQLEHSVVNFSSTERIKVPLHILPGLKPGLHRLFVIAHATDSDWQQRFPLSLVISEQDQKHI